MSSGMVPLPFVHGLFEFQVTRIDTELADLVRKYMADSFKNAMASSASHFLRVIPVQQVGAGSA